MSVPVEGERHEITLSIGAAVVAERSREITPQQLYHAADGALYQAKRGGRARAEIMWMDNAHGDARSFNANVESDCLLATA
jgi:PleD family two-component response regulator